MIVAIIITTSKHTNLQKYKIKSKENRIEDIQKRKVAVKERDRSRKKNQMVNKERQRRNQNTGKERLKRVASEKTKMRKCMLHLENKQQQRKEGRK